MVEERNSIAAIVVTFNRKKLLTECLDGLLSQSAECDVLIVDNASTDGTREYIEAYLEKSNVQYINTGENLGGAGGFNLGMRRAYEQGYEYFWLMDDDTVPSATALEALLKARTELKESFGYLCSLALWTDGSICKMNQPQMSNKNQPSKEEALQPIESATFVSFLVARGIVEKVGLPIKEFFIWADDTNYCWRINHIAQGYLVLDSRVVHKMNSNTSANIVTDDSKRLERYVYAFRNRSYNYRMEKRYLSLYSYIGRKILAILIKAKDHRKERMKYLMIGVWQGIGFNPEIEYVIDSYGDRTDSKITA